MMLHWPRVLWLQSDRSGLSCMCKPGRYTVKAKGNIGHMHRHKSHDWVQETKYLWQSGQLYRWIIPILLHSIKPQREHCYSEQVVFILNLAPCWGKSLVVKSLCSFGFVLWLNVNKGHVGVWAKVYYAVFIGRHRFLLSFLTAVTWDYSLLQKKCTECRTSIITSRSFLHFHLCSFISC